MHSFQRIDIAPRNAVMSIPLLKSVVKLRLLCSLLSSFSLISTLRASLTSLCFCFGTSMFCFLFLDSGRVPVKFPVGSYFASLLPTTVLRQSSPESSWATCYFLFSLCYFILIVWVDMLPTPVLRLLWEPNESCLQNLSLFLKCWRSWLTLLLVKMFRK